MVEVKRINTKRGMRYVKVKPNGQYQFIKKSVYDRMKGGTPKARTSRQSSRSSRTKTGGNRKMGSKLFRNISGMTALEDLIVGYAGTKVIHESQGFSTGRSLALTRVGQGVLGHVGNRRGKRHLVQGVIDYIDLALVEEVPIPILDNLLSKFKFG